MWHFPANCSKVKDDGSVGWSKHGQSRGLQPAVYPTSVSGTFYHALTFTAVARRWPFFYFSFFFSLPSCHALVLNINATLPRARHSWERAWLFLATCPQLHIYSPGAIGQLVFVSNGGRQCCNLLNANRHLERSRLRPVQKPRTPSTCLTLPQVLRRGAHPNICNPCKLCCKQFCFSLRNNPTFWATCINVFKII